MRISSLDQKIVEGADLLLLHCGSLRPEEYLVIICDPQTANLGHLLLERGSLVTNKVELVKIPSLTMHGQEPPDSVAELMENADLLVGITSKSMAHTRARLRATQRRARYLSLPDYSLALLADSSLRADYKAKALSARTLADYFTEGNRVQITSDRGTDISMQIEGRTGNCCPGYVVLPGDLGSPPDIESNVAPLENSAEGIVVVDGSIPFPGIGLLNEPLTLTIKSGRIMGINGPIGLVSDLNSLFDTAGPHRARILAECGVGLNDLAKLSGCMLTDEGAAGTMHFGFGSNSTIGGTNDVSFHLDFVFLKPTLMVDEKIILDKGRLTPTIMTI